MFPQPKQQGWEKNEKRFEDIINNAGRTVDNPDRDPGNGKGCNTPQGAFMCYIVGPAIILTVLVTMAVRGAHNQDEGNSADPIMQNPIPTAIRTPTPTQTPSFTATAAITPTFTPTATATATFTPIPTATTRPTLNPSRPLLLNRRHIPQ